MQNTCLYCARLSISSCLPTNPLSKVFRIITRCWIFTLPRPRQRKRRWKPTRKPSSVWLSLPFETYSSLRIPLSVSYNDVSSPSASAIPVLTDVDLQQPGVFVWMITNISDRINRLRTDPKEYIESSVFMASAQGPKLVVRLHVNEKSFNVPFVALYIHSRIGWTAKFSRWFQIHFGRCQWKTTVSATGKIFRWIQNPHYGLYRHRGFHSKTSFDRSRTIRSTRFEHSHHSNSTIAMNWSSLPFLSASKKHWFIRCKRRNLWTPNDSDLTFSDLFLNLTVSNKEELKHQLTFISDQQEKKRGVMDDH